MSNGLLEGVGKNNVLFDRWDQTDTTTVRQGESTLSDVAQRLGVSTKALLDANPQITNPDQLSVGQDLILPETQPIVTMQKDYGTAESHAAPGSIIGEKDLQGVMMRGTLESIFIPDKEDAAPATGKADSKDKGFMSIFDEDEVPDASQGETVGQIVEKAISMGNRVGTLISKLDALKIPASLRKELKSQIAGKSGDELFQTLDQLDAALSSKDPAGEIKSMVIQGRVQNYYRSFESTYEVNGKQVKAAPHFRITNGFSGQPGRTHADQVIGDLTKLLGSHMKLNPQLRTAIGAVAYGRATADQIKMVTDGLLKSGQFKVAQIMHPGLSDAETIRMMQWDHGIGIDCAGYVQQAFMGVHGGGRGDYGFKSFGNEDLTSLKGNPHFTQVKPVDIKPGDLIILDAPQRGDVGHTVLVRDHHVAGSDELKKFQNPNGFAKAGDKVHVVQVDASWSAGQDGLLSGGVQSRIWIYNETTGKWADATPDGKGGLTITPSTRNGPYDHPMNGIFRPKRSIA